MRFYLASALDNALVVRGLAAELRAAGWEQAYDWTTHGSVNSAGPDTIRRVAAAEAHGVTSADVCIVMLPGARGTHVELGLALGAGRPVLLVAPNERALHDDTGRICAFYRHPLVHVVTAEDGSLIAVAYGIGQALGAAGHELLRTGRCGACERPTCRFLSPVTSFVMRVLDARDQAPGEVAVS